MHCTEKAEFIILHIQSINILHTITHVKISHQPTIFQSLFSKSLAVIVACSSEIQCQRYTHSAF